MSVLRDFLLIGARNLATGKILVYTPMNPTRPYAEYLEILHTQNVEENLVNLPIRWKSKYVSEQVVYVDSRQESGVCRGKHVIESFNQVYEKYKDRYEYICKWDDDLLLPERGLMEVLRLLEKDTEAIGAGLFSTQYGAPNILMANQETEGFTGAFQRFYVYRMSVWGHIQVEGRSGDPDQNYQWQLTGKKIQVEMPHIHLDHRCMPNDNLYRVLLDVAYWVYFK